MNQDLDDSVQTAFKRRCNVVKAEHYEELIRAHERSMERLDQTLKLVGEDTEQWREYMELNNRYKQSLERLRDHYYEQHVKEVQTNRFHTVSLWLMAIGLVATFLGQAVYAHVKAAEIEQTSKVMTKR